MRTDSLPLLWGPVVLVMASIFYVSSLSHPPEPAGLSDKSAHVVAYAVLGVAVVRAAAGGLPRRITLRIAAVAVAIVVGYGMTDEIHQRFVAGRTPEIADLYADAGGALLATIACWAWGILAVPARDRGASHDV